MQSFIGAEVVLATEGGVWTSTKSDPPKVLEAGDRASRMPETSFRHASGRTSESFRFCFGSVECQTIRRTSGQVL